MDDYFAPLFGGFLLAMGIWMLFLGKAAVGRAAQARNWPVTEARITRSEVRRQPGANAKFRLDIRYAYRVGDRDYENDRIAIGGEITAGRHLAEKRQQRYPEDSLQRVYYSPDDPAESCLEPVVEGGGRIEFAGGVVGILLGILLLTGQIG